MDWGIKLGVRITGHHYSLTTHKRDEHGNHEKHGNLKENKCSGSPTSCCCYKRKYL